MEKIKDKLVDYGHLVMFTHSIFSLPFAVIAMLWANNQLPSFYQLFWILLALVGARNGANAFNRFADKDFDKKNPRTANREIPSGKVESKEALYITIAGMCLLVVSAFMLNWLCVVLLPVAIGLLLFYSYTKRYTWMCHFILGACCGGAPVGAWIAMKGPLTITPFIFGAIVTFWVAGFDIIYATQDIDFDLENDLKSVPARFGLEDALMIAKYSHMIAACLLFSLYFLEERSLVYLIGVFVISGLMAVEHYNVNPNNRKIIEFKAYSINQIISLVFLAFGLIDFIVV